MTKEQALYNFFSSFGIPAYEQNSVPSNATYPYITFSVQTDDFGGACNLTMSIYTHGESFAQANTKADEVANVLTMGGKVISCDNGKIWLKRGSPFAQNMGDPNDQVKRKYINITAEYLTI